MPTIIRLLRLAAPFRWWMVLAALLGFLTIGSSIGLMTTAAWIIASAALHPPIGELQLAIVGVRFFGIARGVFRYLERYVSHQTTFRLLARLRVWFYRALEPLAPARLMCYRSGDLLVRTVADIDTLENFYLRVIAPPAVAVMVGGAMMIFMGAFDVWLAASLASFLFVAGVGVPLMTRVLGQGGRGVAMTTRSDLHAALVDGIQGMADLVAYGAADDQIAHVEALSRCLQREQARLARISALNTALISLLTGLATLVTLIIAIPLVTEGRLDGVMLAVLALATITSFEAVLPLPEAFHHLDSNLTAARRLFDLVDADPTVREPDSPLSSSAGEGGRGGEAYTRPLTPLHIQNLRFRYTPDDPPALDGVSFTLPPGGTVAIVGASGAGKTTLVNLLLRFWDYDEGQITLFGRDLHTYAPGDARALFSVVSQHTYLFNSTIRENLLVARPSATEGDLIRAAQAAQVHAFIETLPNGYDTWIGEQGLALSGGERQRIAIARAILKDAPILLLDEPTANLDTVTARAVLDTIFTALPDRTTLLITHHLAGLDAADEILVLHAGQIVERGHHADLLQDQGRYRRMWDQQHMRLRSDSFRQ